VVVVVVALMLITEPMQVRVLSFFVTLPYTQLQAVQV
jgi:hypothetical protein